MGVEGAAIGTLVARLIELGIVFYYNSKKSSFCFYKMEISKKFKSYFKDS